MLRCRGGTKACPISISDLVLLHNKASEGLVKTDRVGYDLYSGIADTKALFIKYCKQYERRIRTLVPVHRVVPAGDGEESTTISVPGFVVDPKAQKKKTFAPQKVELQFLETHKKLFMELHQEFSKSDYAPQSEASLQNFQTLLILVSRRVVFRLASVCGKTNCSRRARQKTAQQECSNQSMPMFTLNISCV